MNNSDLIINESRCVGKADQSIVHDGSRLVNYVAATDGMTTKELSDIYVPGAVVVLSHHFFHIAVQLPVNPRINCGFDEEGRSSFKTEYVCKAWLGLIVGVNEVNTFKTKLIFDGPLTFEPTNITLEQDVTLPLNRTITVLNEDGSIIDYEIEFTYGTLKSIEADLNYNYGTIHHRISIVNDHRLLRLLPL